MVANSGHDFVCVLPVVLHMCVVVVGVVVVVVVVVVVFVAFSFRGGGVGWGTRVWLLPCGSLFASQCTTLTRVAAHPMCWHCRLPLLRGRTSRTLRGGAAQGKLLEHRESERPRAHMEWEGPASGT